MSITLHFETETDEDMHLEDPKGLAKLVIEEALSVHGCPFDGEVSLLVTDDEGIRELNQSFRGIDAPTDVLSFPMQDFPSPGDFSFIDETDEASLADLFDPDSGCLLLGDIVINACRVLSQAEEYGHGERREYAFLIAHSMLHLLGYDHMEEEEAAVMEEKQEEILQRLQITRS